MEDTLRRHRETAIRRNGNIAFLEGFLRFGNLGTQFRILFPFRADFLDFFQDLFEAQFEISNGPDGNRIVTANFHGIDVNLEEFRMVGIEGDTPIPAGAVRFRKTGDLGKNDISVYGEGMG